MRDDRAQRDEATRHNRSIIKRNPDSTGPCIRKAPGSHAQRALRLTQSSLAARRRRYTAAGRLNSTAVASPGAYQLNIRMAALTCQSALSNRVA
jgi:hypothetical protein